MTLQPPSLQRRYALAIFSIVLATLARVPLNPVLGAQATFSTFYLAILLTAWYGGFRPGLVAVVLGGLSANYFIMLPQWSLAIEGPEQQISITLYLVVGVGIALLAGMQRATQDQLERRVLERTAELSRTNDQLRISEERFRFLISDVLDYAIFTLDATGHVTTWNPGAERNKGYRAEEIIGQHFSRFYPQDEIASGTPERALRMALANDRWEGVGWRVRKNGSRFWARIVILALKDEAGHLKGFSKITRDITDSKRAEERFSQAVESAPNGMVLANSEGLITLVNAQTEKLFGYSRDELLGQPVELLIPERFRARHPADRARFMSAPQVRSMGMGRDLNARRKDGSEFPVEIGLNPINTADGPAVLSAIVDITERKRAEEELRDSEERFRMMVNSIPQLAWITHADGSVFWYNQRWYDYTGTTPQQMEGWGWQSVHDPELLPAIMERWKSAIAAGTPFEMEFPLRGADGRFRSFLTRVEPFKDSEGRVVRWFGTSTDVDAMKRMEESLRAAQTRLTSALAAGSIGTWTWDIVNDRLCADEFTARMFSIEPHEALKGLPAESYIQAVNEEDRPVVASNLASAIQCCGNYDIEYRVRQNGGELRWLHAKGRVEGDAGKATWFHGAVMDITDRKRAEEGLMHRKEQLRVLGDNLPGGVMYQAIVSPDGTRQATYLTAGIERLLGIPQAEALANPAVLHSMILPGDIPAVQATEAAAFASRSAFDCEFRSYTRDGAVKWLHSRSAPRPQPDGTVVWDGIVMDVTSRKLAESELHRLNAELEDRVRSRTIELEAANKELEAFSYSVSHDLLAPLRGIDGFSRILLTKFSPQLPPQAQEYLNDVRANSQQMGRLVDDLLAFSRLGRKPVERRQVHTAELVRECLNELTAAREGRQVEIRLGNLPDCEADLALLKQVWLNLLANAIKYSGKCELAVIEIGTSPGSDRPVYFVKDNGVGFDMQYAHKLFGVFQRLHKAEDYEGTGVGLAIVQRIINRHGGRVWAEAEPTKGATFFFSLRSADHATLS